MALSGKQKIFFQFFSSFLKATLILDHFEKKHDPHNSCISEITYSQQDG